MLIFDGKHQWRYRLTIDSNIKGESGERREWGGSWGLTGEITFQPLSLLDMTACWSICSHTERPGTNPTTLTGQWTAQQHYVVVRRVSDKNRLLKCVTVHHYTRLCESVWKIGVCCTIHPHFRPYSHSRNASSRTDKNRYKWWSIYVIITEGETLGS